MLFSVSLVSAGLFSQRNGDKFFNRAHAEHINAAGLSWKAAVQPYAHFANRTVAETKKLMGTRTEMRGTLPKRTYASSAVPDSFDARTQWPNCPSIRQIRDQSACGSCWAFGAAESISDRFCTYLGATDPQYQNVQISANDINSCCDSCGNGCGGGYPEAAFQYWKDTGVSVNGCDPYPFPKCEHHIPKNHYDPCPSSEYDTPACPQKCADGTPFGTTTRYFASDIWSVDGSVQAYQAELLKGGPFEITLSVYADFPLYKTGVYRHQSGDLLGGHAVKVIGWGTDATENLPYWIVANSWNEDWGEGGTFRIVRGTNECGIESGGVAGQPKTL